MFFVSEILVISHIIKGASGDALFYFMICVFEFRSAKQFVLVYTQRSLIRWKTKIDSHSI